jgi:hypothetical protein
MACACRCRSINDGGTDSPLDKILMASTSVRAKNAGDKRLRGKTMTYGPSLEPAARQTVDENLVRGVLGSG